LKEGGIVKSLNIYPGQIYVEMEYDKVKIFIVCFYIIKVFFKEVYDV